MTTRLLITYNKVRIQYLTGGVRGMYRAKITTKGQLTLPKDLRDKLGLRAGDYLLIKETDQGYLLEKELDEERFHKYIGLLGRRGDSEEIIKELRGE